MESMIGHMGGTRRIHLYTLYLTILFAPLFNWAPENGILPGELLWASDVLCLLFFVMIYTHVQATMREMVWCGRSVVAAFIVTWLISLSINGANPYPALVMLRFPVGIYLFFLGLLNMQMTCRDERMLVKTVYIIFLLQIPVAALKYVTIGTGEMPLSMVGHAATTYVSLIGVSFCVAYYLHYRTSPLYLLFCLGFIFVSVVGAKRATVFLLPIVFACQLLAMRRTRLAAVRIMLVAAVAGLPATYLTLRLIPMLNPQGQVWGDFDLSYAMDHAVRYELGETEGRPSGRTSAIMGVYDGLSSDGVGAVLFGYGPGYLVSSRFAPVDPDARRLRSGIAYGFNGLNWMALQVGYIGATIWFTLYMLVLKVAWYCYKREEDAFWRSFAFGMVMWCLIMSFGGYFYSDVYNFKEISIPFFAMSAVLYKRSWRFRWQIGLVHRTTRASMIHGTGIMPIQVG